MRRRNDLAREGAVAALRLRRKFHCSIYEGLCPHDLAQEMGLQVRFEAIPSLEGVYCASTPPAIILSSLRPPGRRAFTCAHEIGHHIFGHGTRVDQIEEDRDEQTARDPQEYLADRFASELLMPKLAVQSGFSRRGWKPFSCTPQNLYVVAESLGVGFGTLVDQMEHTLLLLSPRHASGLRRVSLKRIRQKLLASEVGNGLIVVDLHWARPIDAEVDDTILMPGAITVAGEALKVSHKSNDLLVAHAVCPGTSMLLSAGGSWEGSVRVARRAFEGLSQYRFLEDPDYA